MLVEKFNWNQTEMNALKPAMWDPPVAKWPCRHGALTKGTQLRVHWSIHFCLGPVVFRWMGGLH